MTTNTDRKICRECGPGCRIGDDGCRHTTDANADREALALIVWESLDKNVMEPTISTIGAREVADAIRTSHWLDDRDARIAGEARLEGRSEAAAVVREMSEKDTSRGGMIRLWMRSIANQIDDGRIAVIHDAQVAKEARVAALREAQRIAREGREPFTVNRIDHLIEKEEESK